MDKKAMNQNLILMKMNIKAMMKSMQLLNLLKIALKILTKLNYNQKSKNQKIKKKEKIMVKSTEI